VNCLSLLASACCRKLLPYGDFCFNILSITFDPAFAFSDFDVAGCLGFAFDVFCVFSCVTKPYGFELLTLPSVALFF